MQALTLNKNVQINGTATAKEGNMATKSNS
jgi:hypothetical protein